MSENKGKLFIVSAPSGAGKTTLVNEVLHRIADKYDISRVVTYTTRNPREGEQDGNDYNFITNKEFTEKSNNGFFLESTKFANNGYASPASITEEMKLNKSFILVIDREGAKNIKQVVHDAVTVWIAPPNLDILKSRMITRQTESTTQIEERLNIAKKEIEYEKKHRFYKYHVVNNVFDNAVAEMVSIIEDELA